MNGAITTFEKASGYRYRIEVSPDEVHWKTLADRTAANTTAATDYTHTDTPVAGRFVRLTVTGSSWNGGSIYDFQVYGTPRTVTDHTAPTAPGQPTVKPLLPGLVDVSWPAATDDTGVTSYVVYQDGKRIAVTDATTLRVPGLTADTSYSFTVVARDEALNASTPSKAAVVTTPADDDLALNRTATASSESDGHAPANAVDGDLSTRWAQGLGLPDPSWLQVDLGKDTAVSAGHHHLRADERLQVPPGVLDRRPELVDVRGPHRREHHRADRLRLRRHPRHRALSAPDRHRFQRQRRQRLRAPGVRRLLSNVAAEHVASEHVTSEPKPFSLQKTKARMKITHVEVHRIDVPAASPPFRWRDGLSGSAPAGDGAVLRIGTDEGVEGVAVFARPGAHSTLRDLVDRVFRAELLGADPFQREWLWHRVWELDRIHELPLPTLGLIDIALWDLAGRYHGEPVWRLLGGFRDAIPAYASTSTFSSTAEFLDVADQCLALGYRGIKLHAWGDARRDADLCLALRAHVGPDVP